MSTASCKPSRKITWYRSMCDKIDYQEKKMEKHDKKVQAENNRAKKKKAPPTE